MTGADALTRRVEEASLNAWPAMRQTMLDGWLLRFARGFTKRANSIVPLYPSLQPDADKVAYCENLYARERLKTIFRITSIADCQPLDEYLKHRGYRHMDPTQVMLAPLTKMAPAIEPGTEVPGAPGVHFLTREEWLDRYALLAGMPDAAKALHGAIIMGISSECGFAVLEDGGTTLACGLAVAEASLVGLFDIVTAADARRQGHGRALVGSLLNWGRARQAEHAYLQMVTDNHAAAGLYAGFGFQECYRYWYRVSG